MHLAHAGEVRLEQLVRCREEHAVVGRPLDGLAPRVRAGLSQCPSSLLKPILRPAREHHQRAGSFSYIRFYHIDMPESYVRQRGSVAVLYDKSDFALLRRGSGFMPSPNREAGFSITRRYLSAEKKDRDAKRGNGGAG